MTTTFKRGEFREYRATTKIHLGAIESDIFEDDIVEFDGQTLIIGDIRHNLPQLRAGIKKGWLVNPEDNVSKYVPQPAGVLVRPAESVGRERGEPMRIETATEDEKVVGNLDAHQKRRKDAERQPMTRAAARPPIRPTRRQAAPGPVPAHPDPGTQNLDGLDPADVAAVERANAINKQRIAEAMSQEVPPPVEYEDEPEDEGDGKFRPQVIDASAQDGVAVGGYSFSGGAKVGVEGDKHLREGTRVDRMQRPRGVPVASTPQRERKTQIPADGNTDIHDTLEGGATGDVSRTTSGETLSELLPDAAVSHVPDPSFQWDKSGHWRTRVKTAVDQFGDNPEAIKLIMGAETPSVCKHIQAALDQR